MNIQSRAKTKNEFPQAGMTLEIFFLIGIVLGLESFRQQCMYCKMVNLFFSSFF